MKMLIALLLGAVAAASAGSPETAISVPGMSQYTDASFGFSFWYPATWTVKEETYDNAKSPYSGGSVIKSLAIAPPIMSPVAAPTIYDDTDIQPFHILEFVSPDENIMESSHPGRSLRNAAAISGNTIGGLPFFSGAASSGEDTIVPIGAEKFVIVAEYGSGYTHCQIHLARTIAAIHPASGAPAGRDEQVRRIRTEGVLYGAIGRRIGDFYVDDQYLYNIRGEMIPGANPKNFQLISRVSDGTEADAQYGTDGIRVYWNNLEGDAAQEILEGADPKTFVCLRHTYLLPSPDGHPAHVIDECFAKDKSHVWFGRDLIPGADPNTFVIIDGPDIMAQDGKHKYGQDSKYNIVVRN